MQLIACTFVTFVSCLFLNSAIALETPKSVKDLQQERVALLREVVVLVTNAFNAGESTFESVVNAQHAFLDASLEIAETAEQRVAVLQEGVAVAEKNVGVVTGLVEGNGATRKDLLIAKCALLERQIALMRETDN